MIKSKIWIITISLMIAAFILTSCGGKGEGFKEKETLKERLQKLNVDERIGQCHVGTIKTRIIESHLKDIDIITITCKEGASNRYDKLVTKKGYYIHLY